MTEPAAAIVVAAGSSTRMGFDKLWARVGDAPLIAWSLRALASSPDIAQLILVTHADAMAKMNELLRQLSIRADVVRGGAQRSDSVRAGLGAVQQCEWVLVHDGARPFVTPDLIHRGLEAATATGAAIAAVPVVDTIKVVDVDHIVSTPDRQALWAAQTPQVFRTALLGQAHASAAASATDDAVLVEAIGAEVRVFMGAYGNIKITTTVDLQLANVLAQQMAAPPV